MASPKALLCVFGNLRHTGIPMSSPSLSKMFIARFHVFRKSWHNILTLKRVNHRSGLALDFCCLQRTQNYPSASWNSCLLFICSSDEEFRVSKVFPDGYQGASSSMDLSAMSQMFRKKRMLYVAFKYVVM